MNTTRASDDREDLLHGWRAAAPRARRAAMAVFSWREPGWSFLYAIGGAALFVAAAVFAPALLSLSPTVDLIGPIAEARAVFAGEAAFATQDAPLYLLLLAGADIFVDAPGRVHLVAKAMGAILLVYTFASLCVTRFPALFSALATAALAAFIAAPFSGAEELGLALFLACGLCFLTMTADDSASRARFEGALGGVILIALWLLNPVFALIGFVMLSACPFLTGRFALWRYVTALVIALLLAGLLEFVAPGVNAARAEAAQHLSLSALVQSSESAIGMGAAAFGALMVLTASAVFGGAAHWRNWVSAGGLMLAGVIAAKLTNANPLPVFALSAGVACFSVASPFYDGLFRHHDRASVATSLIAAGLTLFWTGAIVLHALGQFSLQHRLTLAAPENFRTELALVQPGGPTIANWVEEGRFSTPEAREFFALTPVDQSAMLLEAADRARRITAGGLDVAFLTGADTACVLAEQRACYADGPAAAKASNVVFVPRLEMDPKTTEAKGRAEALLYTQFKMVERTALWEIWVRRDEPTPAGMFPASDALYR
ncbi:MAG: hypothetical protein AAFW68_06335 [Pseudomonadota bacterium]